MTFLRRALMMLVAASLGCGGGQRRVEVSGKVSLDDRPLPSGTITFTPLEGGRSAGGAISDGSFAIGPASGPSPGRYRVEIVGFEETGRTVEDEDLPGRGQPELRQVVPERYNVESILEADLEAAANRLEFALATESP